MLTDVPMLQERDWKRTIEQFISSGEYPVMPLDDIFTDNAISAIHSDVLRCHEWEPPGGAAMRWNRPQAPSFQRAGTELSMALQPIVQGMKIISYWLIAAARGPGIRMHADNATYSINIWLTPASNAESMNADGMVFYNVNRPDRMSYKSFSSHDYCEYYVRDRSGVPEKRIPYRFNRAVIFDSRVMHRSEEVTFADSGSVLSRRLNLTFSWDKLEWARERMDTSG
jgi:hypothetical protein